MLGRMRDLFDDLKSNEPVDPVAAAQRAMRPPLRRRFYEQVTVVECEGRFDLLLDGRPVRTPARNPLGTPTRALSEAVAAEWRAQGESIDPSSMPLTRLVNSIIDGVATSASAVAADVAKFLASDLVVYRAEGPQGLVEKQAAAWDPVVAWARDELGAALRAGGGDDLCRPAGSGARRCAGRNSPRYLAAGRGTRHHHAHGFGTDRARGAAWPARRGRRLDGGACRRGLEYGFLGPRRGRRSTAARFATRSCWPPARCWHCSDRRHFFDSVP